MKTMSKKIVSMMLALLIICASFAGSVFAESSASLVSLKSDKLLYELSLSSKAKGSLSVAVVASNNDSAARTVSVSPDFTEMEDSFALKSISDASKTIEPGKTHSFTMEFVLTGVSSKIYTVPVTLTDDLGKTSSCDLKIKVDVEDYVAPTTDKATYIPSVSLSYTVNAGKGSIKAGQNNLLRLNIKNSGACALSNCTVQIGSISGDVSIYNGSDNVNVGDLPYSGYYKDVDFYLYAASDAKNGIVSIPVILSGYDPNGDMFTKSETLYIPLENTKSSDGGKSVVTPIIMVTEYKQKGTALAGSSFSISFTLTNTSSKNLRNIKVTVGDGGGIFVPKGSSNAYYVEAIESKKTNTHSMTFTVSPDAPQAALSMNVSMNYEDYEGNCYSSSDTIAISVLQETKFVLDTFEAPSYAWVNENVSSEIKFYNMGKNTINNVQASVSGDFKVTKNQSVYFGNISSGSTNTYKFTMVPSTTGTVSGTIVFSYDDAAGKTQTQEVSFSYNVDGNTYVDPGEDPGYIDPEPIEEPKSFPLIPVLIGVVVVGAGVLIFLKSKKKKKNQSLDLDDED